MNSQIPAASLQTDFDAWWNTEGEWVEAANLCRDGESGVQRLMPSDPQRPVLYIKRQTGHLYRSMRHPFGRPTILRELNAYRAWEKLGIRLPKIVFVGARRQHGQWQALLVTEALTGFRDMAGWYGSGDYLICPAEDRQTLLCQLAAALVRIHRAGWQHGCLYPKHIFVKTDGGPELALLDLEKCRRRLNRGAAARKDLDQLFRHRGAMPEEDWACFQRAVETEYGSLLT